MLLLFWPQARLLVPSREALTSFSFTDPPPPTPPPPPAAKPGKPRAAQAEGAAGKKATPSPVIAKAIPIVQPSDTPPSEPASGDDASRGAALAGAGPGAGGQGSGPGGGGTGGDGAGGGAAEPAEWVGGEIRDSDYPRRARSAGLQGTVETEIAVAANGRPSGCSIVRSSGSAELDQATCRLIMRRFRFRPARDRLGRAIPDIVGYDQEWRREQGGE
jgi:protein TonB